MSFLNISLPSYSDTYKNFRRCACAALMALALSVPNDAQAQAPAPARWVSDSLSTYVRSGPTDGYRIVGTLQAGAQVELLRVQGDYSQVRSASGDTVWIASKDLQTAPGPAERVPQLQQEVATLRAELKTINDSWTLRVQGMQETLDSRKALIEELQVRTHALNEELGQAQSQLRTAQAKLGDENSQLLMRYLSYGAGIAGAGLLLGLMLPTLMRTRKRNERWF